MPSRNIIRRESPHAYYHVYARGANKKPIFIDDTDRAKFIALLDRYLAPNPVLSKTGEAYPSFYKKARLLAYCMMGNHFHLLMYQDTAGDITAFMRSLMTSYVRYFNLRHKRTGSLFESRFKSSLIDDDSYLHHISRYIHLNPRNWKYYKYSSINFYRRGNEPVWLDTSKVLDLFRSRQEYIAFLYDYEDYKEMLDEIKYDLADK